MCLNYEGKKTNFRYTSRSLWDTPSSNALISFYFILFFISSPTEWEISLWQPQCCNTPVSPHTSYTLTFSAVFCIFLDKKKSTVRTKKKLIINNPKKQVYQYIICRTESSIFHKWFPMAWGFQEYKPFIIVKTDWGLITIIFHQLALAVSLSDIIWKQGLLDTTIVQFNIIILSQPSSSCENAFGKL